MMLRSSDIQVIKMFRKVERLLLSGIIATLTALAVCVAFIIQSM